MGFNLSIMDVFHYKATDKLTSKPVDIIGFDFENNDAVIRIDGIITIKPLSILNLFPSTGLKDKNGNIIFAGDKLQFTAHKGFTLKTQVLEVIWIEELACFGYVPENNQALQYSFSEHDELNEDLLQYCEIINN
jgi:hypothetical protein